jgi:DNA ligase-1
MKAPSKALHPRELLALKAPRHYASFKIDGIRCLGKDGEARSRTLKLIPNEYIRESLRALDIEGLDGELLLRGDVVPFEEVTSAVMSRAGQPDFIFWVFDDFTNPDLPYFLRYATARARVRAMPKNGCVRLLTHTDFTDLKAMQIYERQAVDRGYEGIMIRSVSAPYKFGTSTLKEEGLLKCKRFLDDEAIVTGFEEEMRNDNEATINALGLKERSSKKGNKTGAGTLGKLVCAWQGHEIRISGFTAKTAAEIWAAQSRFMGKLAKFRFQELTEAGLPRFGQFKGFRDPIDL